MRNSFLKNLGFKILLIGALAISLLTGFLIPKYLQISNLVLKPKNLPVFIRDLTGSSLLFIDVKALEEEILANNPTLERVTVTKEYPDTLRITLRLGMPIAQIESLSKYYLVNKKGKILKIKRTADLSLPILKSYQKLRHSQSQPGQLLTNPDLLYALLVVKLAPQYEIDFKYLEISKPTELKIVGGKTITYLNTKKQIAKNLEIMQNIIVALNRKGQIPKEINLFFEKAAYTL